MKDFKIPKWVMDQGLNIESLNHIKEQWIDATARSDNLSRKSEAAWITDDELQEDTSEELGRKLRTYIALVRRSRQADNEVACLEDDFEFALEFLRVKRRCDELIRLRDKRERRASGWGEGL